MSNNRDSYSTKTCPMYLADEHGYCQRCGLKKWDHPMSRRRYYNDPETRAFLERLDNLTWWESLLCWAIFLCWVPLVLVARLFGWRPGDE